MHRHRIIAAVAFGVLSIVQTLAAQDGMRRSSANGPGPDGLPPLAVLKDIPADPAHPFAGVWQGTFTPDGDPESMPETLTIEFLNGTYTGYTSFGSPPRGAAPHRSVALVGKSLRWEMPNSGGGFLVYTAELTDANTMKGVLTSRDVPFPPGVPTPKGTFAMKRRQVSK